MPAIRDELRLAGRALRRSPLTSASIVATLAICIAAITAVYSIVGAILWRALPYREPDRLLWVASVARGRADAPFSLPEFLDYRAQATSIRLAAYTNWSAARSTPDGARRLQGLRMTGDAFDLLGARPAAGRLFSAADDEIDAPHVVLLTYAYWQRELAADPRAIGQTLQLNGEAYTMVGVLPKYFPLSVRNIDIIVPLVPGRDPRRNARSSTNFLRVVGRPQPGVSSTAAEQELIAIGRTLRERFPSDYAAKLSVHVTPLQEYLVGNQRPTLVILSACVTLMLIVALANILNLLVARAVARQTETGVRIALGASLRQIAAQFAAEGAVLSLCGGAAGIAIGAATIRYVVARAGSIVPRLDETTIDVPVLVMVAGVCTFATLLFSLIPLAIAGRGTPLAALRAGGRGRTTSLAQVRLRSAFVVAQIAFAVMIAAATAALTRSLVALERLDLGYRPDSVFVARLALPPSRYRTLADLASFSDRLQSAIRAQPGVVNAGMASIAPLSGALWSISFAREDQPPPRKDWPAANYRPVSPGYFATLGATIRAGRDIGEQDDASAPPVAVVSQALADAFFPRGGAIGRRLVVDDNDIGPRPVTIVGVVNDMRHVTLDGPQAPDIYLALDQIQPGSASFIAGSQFWTVRVRTDPAVFAPTFLRALQTVDPSVATSGLMPLRGYVEATLSPRRFSVSLLVAFALMAIVLTTLGVYAVSAYQVEQRRREIGVRVALGATAASIAALILGQAIRLAIVGIALGLCGAYAMKGLMSSVLFGISAGDPLVLLTVGAVVLFATLLASWLPSRRAARIDPVIALAGE